MPAENHSKLKVKGAMTPLITEVADISPGSVEFAKGIDYATAGDRLGKVVRASIEEHRPHYNRLRAAVHARLESFGGVGEKEGLFILAADLALTARLQEAQLTSADTRDLRRFWDDLRSR